MAAKAEKSLKKAPKGSLMISNSNGTKQYYQMLGDKQKKKKYISASNKDLVRSLAQKDYDKIFLKVANREIKQVKKILEILPNTELIDVYSKLIPQRKELVEPYILDDEQYVRQWLSVEYKGKPFDKDAPEIMTEKGERVRSKSEKIIADKLKLMGIPYRYEYPLKLKGFGTVYPDFTLLNVNTRKEIYMEHFGMMDNEEYCRKAINKLEQYTKNGIYIGENLIVTFETSLHPLKIQVLECILNELVPKEGN